MNLIQWLKHTLAGDRQPVVSIPDGPHTPPVRRWYRFSGRVQGVGFRFEAMTLADQLGLVGWAQNETDGSVVMEVEGEAGYIDALLQAMQQVPRFAITDIQVKDLPLSQTENAFRAIY